MNQKVKKAIKAISFVIIALVIYVLCNFIAQPFWSYEQYNPTHGFYEEPNNTIETIFLGASHVHYGISPMELYEQYGICAYDLSTPVQPVTASYFWLEEAYNYHEETLDTVIFDTSVLREDPNVSRYHEAIDPLHFSLTKIHAVKSYSEDFEDFMQNIIPLFSYHERWKDLSQTDFLKYEYEPDLFFRGYYYSDNQTISAVSEASDIYMPLKISDEKEENVELDETAIQYFKKMVSFCEMHNIKLVLINTPTAWTSAEHDAVQKLADSYGLDFIDFNIEPYYSEIGYNFASDSGDARVTATNIHANYYGARKLTDYIGNYLIDKCNNRDVRDDAEYEFMEKELADYNQYIAFRQSLSNATDSCDYIETALDSGDYTVFISVKDDAASALTEEQRAYLASIGLTELSQMTYGCSYLSVIDNGDVITEQYQKDPGEDNETDDLITYSGTLHNGTAYTVVSGGYHMGNQSSIIIEDTERSSNKRGLNIAIYDNEMQRYVTNANFDTHDAPEREAPFNEQNYEALIEEGTPASSLTGTDRIMYLYNRECENDEIAKLARLEKDEDDGLITYLKAFWDDEDVDIFITTQGDVSDALTETERSSLSELRLPELSQISDQDSYVAAICGGEIELEESRNSAIPLEVSTDQYTIRSMGREGPDTVSSVIINGTEYAPEEDGIFIVIYDNITEMAVDMITFEPKTDDVYEAGEVAG